MMGVSRCVFVAAAYLFATFASAQEPALEYRLEKTKGYPIDWADGTHKFFHELPFMRGKDFTKAVVAMSKNPNAPGTYDVEIRHSAAGKIKFRAVADADRERSYCVIFRAVIRGCSSFAPPVKDIYNGSIIFGLSKVAADNLVRDINQSLR